MSASVHMDTTRSTRHSDRQLTPKSERSSGLGRGTDLAARPLSLPLHSRGTDAIAIMIRGAGDQAGKMRIIAAHFSGYRIH